MKLLISALFAIAALAGTAFAAGDADVQGAACSPKAGDYNRFANDTGGVTFASGVSGWVDFWCAIPHASDMSTPTTLEIHYSDDSTTSGNQVIVSYYKQHRTTGVLTEIASVLSNSCTSGYSKTCSTTFSDTFDNTTYRYMIAVSLNRSATATEIFFGATIK